MAETMEWEEIEVSQHTPVPFGEDKTKLFEAQSSPSVSGIMELIMMEVDPVCTESSSSVGLKQVVAVPDTNIFIHSLDLIRNLFDGKFDSEACLTVALPWAVLQELDGLRKAVKNAQVAINYINDLLVQKHPQLRPQKPSEVALAKQKFQESNEDDSILQCALYWCDRVTNGVVVFITNDKNLRNKSMVFSSEKLITCNGDTALAAIRSYIKPGDSDSYHKRQREKHSRESRTAEDRNKSKSLKRVSVVRPLPVAPVSQSQSTSQSRKRTRDKSSSSSSTRTTSGSRRNSEPRSHQESPSFTPPRKKAVKPLPSPVKCESFAAVIEVMQNTFAHIIEFQMKEDFGENWLELLRISPPWTFETGLKCILLHWIAVFSFVFGRKKEIAEELYESFRKYKKSSSRSRSESEEEIIELCLALFNAAEKNKSKVVGETQVILAKKSLLEYLHKRENKS